MSQGEKPTHYVALKNKATGEKVYIADGWSTQYGYNLAFRKERTGQDGTRYVGVEALKLTDGTVIRPEEWFVNMGTKKTTTTTNTTTDNYATDDDFTF